MSERDTRETAARWRTSEQIDKCMSRILNAPVTWNLSLECNGQNEGVNVGIDEFRDWYSSLVRQRDELLEAAKGMIDMPADTPEFFHARARLRSAVEEAE